MDRDPLDTLELTVEPEESVTATVVRGMSEVTATPAEELQPLYRAIEPDALNALYSSFDEKGTIAFSYNGYDVTVTHNDTVMLQPLGE